MRACYILIVFIITFNTIYSDTLDYEIKLNNDNYFKGTYLLPLNTDINNVKIFIDNKEISKLSINNKDSLIVSINDEQIKIKPLNTYVKISRWGNFKLLDIAFFSCDDRNRLKIITSKRNINETRYNENYKYYEKIKNIVKNSDLLEQYDRFITPANNKPGFIIMTTNKIADTVPALQDYIQMKEEMGYEVSLVTQDAWGGGVGNTAAENIKNWLKNNYNNINMKYVLFVGYPHPEKGEVPMKMTWPRLNAADDYKEAPTDLYYGDLTGNWDIDNDGNYGEFEDDFMVNGGSDYYCELNIGRIPVYTKTDVDHIFEKLIRYEKESKVSAESWRYNVLLAMNNMNDVNDSNFTPGIRLAEAIKNNIIDPKNFTSFRIYDDNYSGFGITEPAELTPCTYATVKNTWNSQDFGVVLWQAHGFAQHATDVMSIPYSKVLNDERVPFVMSTSCQNGRPETDNLSMYLLQNGAINVVSASRVEFWIPGQKNYWKEWPSGQSICYNYANNLIADSLSSSEALNLLRATIDVSMLQLNSMWWMNWLVYNVYGDPSHGLYTWEHSLDNKTSIKELKKPDKARNIMLVNNPVEQGGNIDIICTDDNIAELFVEAFDYLGNKILSKEYSCFQKLYTIENAFIIPGTYCLIYKCKYNNGEKKDYYQIMGVK